MQYNTVVSGAMKMINTLEDAALALAKASSGDSGAGNPDLQVAVVESFGILLRCMYPVTPHIAQSLWVGLGYAGVLGDLLDAPWPQVDETALQQDELELVLQINGKLRGAIRVPSTASKSEIEAIALTHELVQKQLMGGGAAKRVIVVPGRLVNIVI
jgi:leucyl-tRNA synthetase